MWINYASTELLKLKKKKTKKTKKNKKKLGEFPLWLNGNEPYLNSND